MVMDQMGKGVFRINYSFSIG